MSSGRSIAGRRSDVHAGRSRLLAQREERLVSWIAPWIPRGSSVIDIGAGSGLVAEALITSLEVKATLVDVVDYNRSALPLQLYDGRRLPFEARRFTVRLLASSFTTVPISVGPSRRPSASQDGW